MRQHERAAVVAACRYVDHILLDCDWTPTLSYLDSHGIDVLTGDEQDEELNMEVTNAGRFRLLPRTEGDCVPHC